MGMDLELNLKIWPQKIDDPKVCLKETKKLLCEYNYLADVSNISITDRNSRQENTCAKVSFFKKVAGYRPATFIKKELPAQVFNCESFFRNF